VEGLDGEQRLTLQLENVTLRRALEEVAERVGASMAVTRDEVLLAGEAGAVSQEDTMQVSAKFVEMTPAALETLAAEDEFFAAFSLGSGENSSQANLFLSQERLAELVVMLQDREGVELLSAPRVITLIGQVAHININRILSYPQSFETVGEDSKLVPTGFKERTVGISLMINSDRDDQGIILEIQPQQTYVDGYIQYPEGIQVSSIPEVQDSETGKVYVPVFVDKGANTTARLEDDLHLAMGGLRGVTSTFAALQHNLAGQSDDKPAPAEQDAMAAGDQEQKILLVFVSAVFQEGQSAAGKEFPHNIKRRRILKPVPNQ
jgi:hypothetical protein